MYGCARMKNTGVEKVSSLKQLIDAIKAYQILEPAHRLRLRLRDRVWSVGLVPGFIELDGQVLPSAEEARLLRELESEGGLLIMGG